MHHALRPLILPRRWNFSAVGIHVLTWIEPSTHPFSLPPLLSICRETSLTAGTRCGGRTVGQRRGSHGGAQWPWPPNMAGQTRSRRGGPGPRPPARRQGGLGACAAGSTGASSVGPRRTATPPARQRSDAAPYARFSIALEQGPEQHPVLQGLERRGVGGKLAEPCLKRRNPSLSLS